MSENIVVKVGMERVFKNGKDWELHNRRAEILHQLFDSNPIWEVKDWGKTDDKNDHHEFVEIVLAVKAAVLVAANPLVATAVGAAVGAIVTGVGAVVSSVATNVISDWCKKFFTEDLNSNQVKETIKDVTVTITNGKESTTIVMDIQNDKDLRVQSPNGVVTIEVNKIKAEQPSPAS